MIIRIDYYLILLFLTISERVMKYLERGMEAQKTSKSVQVKREAQSKSNPARPLEAL